MKYRLTIGKHVRWEAGQPKRYTAGDVFEPSEAELKAFGDRLEAVVETEQPAPEAQNAPIEITTSEEALLKFLHDLKETPEILEGAASEGIAVSVETVEEIGEGVQLPGSGDLEPVAVAQEPESKPEPIEEETPALYALYGMLTKQTRDALTSAGVDSMEKLAKLAADPDALEAVKGIGKATAKKIREALMAIDDETPAGEE